MPYLTDVEVVTIRLDEIAQLHDKLKSLTLPKTQELSTIDDTLALRDFWKRQNDINESIAFHAEYLINNMKVPAMRSILHQNRIFVLSKPRTCFVSEPNECSRQETMELLRKMRFY